MAVTSGAGAILFYLGLAVAAAGYSISGSMHDFKDGPILHQDGNLLTYGSCSKCHSMHSGSSASCAATASSA